MKSLTTVFLLLVGLIVTCTASNIDDNNDRLQGSSSPSSEESEGYPTLDSGDDIMGKLETACYEKTGSNQTFNALIASFGEVQNCFDTQIDVANLENDSNRLNASTRHDFFPKYCPQLRNAIPCVQPKFKLFRQCLGDDIFEVRKFNAWSEFLDLVCENDGEILFRNGTNYDVCMERFSIDQDRCENMISISTAFMAVSKYGETQCEELDKSRDCMERALKKCNGSKLIDLHDVYWRAILKNSPCDTETV